jgi:hypothetical protein
MSSSPAEFAAEISPHLDRLRLGVMRSAVEAGMRSGLLPESGMSAPTFQVFAMLRNAYPDRVVPLTSYQAVYVYQEPTAFATAREEMLAKGVVDAVDADCVVLTDSGRSLIEHVRAFNAGAAEAMWGTGALEVLPLADRCAAAAIDSRVADGALGLVAPLYDEPGNSDAARLSERMTVLRYHRFDAHVSAWRAAGLTATSVRDLTDGELREQIEARTNELAAEAYAVLSDAERDSLLLGLAGLPDQA